MRKHPLNQNWGQTWKSTKNGFKYRFFVFSYRSVKGHNLSRINYSVDRIRVVVNISEWFINVYLCSLKSSIGVKIIFFSRFKLLVQKNSNTVCKTFQKFIVLPYDIFLKNDIVILIDSFDAFINNCFGYTMSFKQNEEKIELLHSITITNTH